MVGGEHFTDQCSTSVNARASLCCFWENEISPGLIGLSPLSTAIPLLFNCKSWASTIFYPRFTPAHG